MLHGGSYGFGRKVFAICGQLHSSPQIAEHGFTLLVQILGEAQALVWERLRG